MKRLTAAFAAVLTCALSAQQVFKSGVDVTPVDVTVVDRDGTPVHDLKAADFTVTVDGKPRAIVSAQFVSSAHAAVSATAAAPAGHRDYASNVQPTPGRLIALVIDQGNIRMGGERSVLKAAEGFLDRLTPADRVALLTFPAPGPVVNFTGDLARATVNVLHLGSEAFDASEPHPFRGMDQAAQTVGLETVAGVTGGELLTVVGTGAHIFERIAREIAGNYLLGIETLDQDRDGKPHRIKVSVRRRGLQVRARRELGATAPANQPTARLAEHSAADDILAALRAPLVSAAVPIRVSSYVLPDPDRLKLRIVLAAEIGEAAAPTRMGVGYELRDPEGHTIARRASPVMLRPGADGRLEYREAFSVKPGDYAFKLAVADAAGRIGTIDHAIRARLTRIDAIEVADLLLNDAMDLERGTPVPVEAVVVSGKLSCAVDLRTEPGAMPDQARVSIELVDGGGRHVMTAVAPLASDENGVRHIERGLLDTSRLAPGDYVAHAVISVAGSQRGEVTRGFQVRSPAIK